MILFNHFSSKKWGIYILLSFKIIGLAFSQDISHSFAFSPPISFADNPHTFLLEIEDSNSPFYIPKEGLVFKYLLSNGQFDTTANVTLLKKSPTGELGCLFMPSVPDLNISFSLSVHSIEITIKPDDSIHIPSGGFAMALGAVIITIEDLPAKKPQLNKSHFSVVNQSNRNILISSLEKNNEIKLEIWSLSGIIVWRSILTTNNSFYKIDLSNLPRGIYLIKACTSEWTEAHKILLN